MELPKTADVIVIGGGVMGASTTYHLAKTGCKNAVLLEKEKFCGVGATGLCAGGIRHQFSTEINVRLSILSLEMLKNFEKEFNQPIDLRWPGYLFLLTRPQDVKLFDRNVQLQRSLGIQTQWLEPHQVASLVPLIKTDDVLAATYCKEDGLADPAGVVNGYISAARKLGAKIITDCEVTGIQIKNNSVCGVVTRHGAIASPVAVNAAGPFAGKVGEMAGLDVPVVPIKRQIAVTAPLAGIPDDFPFVLDFAKSLYFHREGKGILTGMSNPNQKPGFDSKVDSEWTITHLENAIDRFPLLEKADLQSEWAGLYEVTPDAHPILGATPQLKGFINANGFSGHGFMHGPVTGLLIAEVILEGKAKTLDLSNLDLERFEQGREIREQNVV